MDQIKSEKFVEKLLDIVNHGALNLMISIGYRTGLFDSMSGMKPSTSEEIADASGLNERYVREWLGCMVTGKIVEYDHENKTYLLPPEHAAWLTREAAPENIAVTTQWLSVLGSVEDGIVECFKNGGGLSYDDYHRFHEVMSDESRQTVIIPLIDTLLPLADGLVDRLKVGIKVLDVGCGSGFALIEMAKNFPNSNFTGYDLSSEAIEKGENIVREESLTNLKLEVKDVSTFEDEEKFDLITTFDAVHDQAMPEKVLSNIFNALKEDGTYFMQDISGTSHLHKDIDHPVGTFLYTISCMHCMSVSLGQNGKGLGAMWGKDVACKMLKEAGFSHVEVKELPHDPTNYFYIIKK